MVVYNRDKKELTIPIGWGAIEDIQRDYSQIPMGLRFPKGGSFYCHKSEDTSGVGDKYFYVSLNGGEWQRRSNLETEADKLILKPGDSLRFKGENVRYGSDFMAYGAYTRFAIEGEGVELSGNIMSLCYGDNFSGVTEHNYNCVFPFLFSRSSIVNAEHLILPLKRVPLFGYHSMFLESHSLAKSPLIEAVSTDFRGLAYMFAYCDSLSEVHCYLSEGQNTETANWFYGVSFPNGIFYGKNVNEWETGVNGIPEGWERVEI